MKIISHSAAGLIAILAGTACAEDPETRVKMKDLPPLVRAAVKEQLKAATLKGLARDVENGTT
ncbi:MAG: hypothetical protein WKF37_21750 [Bryobacteraceae bacterium]